MNKTARALLGISCVLGAAVSAGVSGFMLISTDPEKSAFGEWLAPVHVNIEMDRRQGNNLSILSQPMNAYYYMAPTAPDDDSGRVIMHAALRASGFHRRLFIRIPEGREARVINSMDNISVFIGNKPAYFSRNEIEQFSRQTENGYTLLKIPSLHYAKSLILKDWVNYYGEYNIALKVWSCFLLYPGRFILTWLFLLALYLLYRKLVNRVSLFLMGQSWFPALVVLFGFALRVNGYVRHSGWSDEIYSAVVAGNPNLPLVSILTDGGNPPFYFMLLRFWFLLFGWSEEAGTMLSVLLGSLAVPALYLLVKEHCGRRTALLAAFFMAVSGFAIGYSQEMRAYILKMFLVPLCAFFFLRFLKKQSPVNMLWYCVLSIAMANAHYYGILFVMANGVFYVLYSVYNKNINRKRVVLFFAGNILAALSCMPYLLYQMMVKRYYFDRDTNIRPDYILVFALIAVVASVCAVYRHKIASYKTLDGTRKLFLFYSALIPVLIFVLSFLISIVKPMINYRYLMPVSFPFFLSICAMLVFLAWNHKAGRYAAVFMAWTVALSLYEGKPGIPGGGDAYYRESRAWITADSAAHPGQKSAILDNADQIARYYGEPDLPEYSPERSFDVLYVFNRIFDMHEEQMYDELAKHGIDDAGILKIIPHAKIVIFKKYLHPR